LWAAVTTRAEELNLPNMFVERNRNFSSEVVRNI